MKVWRLCEILMLQLHRVNTRKRNLLHTRCVQIVSNLRSYLCVGAILHHPNDAILRSSPHLIEPHAPSGASTS